MRDSRPSRLRWRSNSPRRARGIVKVQCRYRRVRGVSPFCAVCVKGQARVLPYLLWTRGVRRRNSNPGRRNSRLPAVGRLPSESATPSSRPTGRCSTMSRSARSIRWRSTGAGAKPLPVHRTGKTRAIMVAPSADHIDRAPSGRPASRQQTDGCASAFPCTETERRFSHRDPSPGLAGPAEARSRSRR